MSGGSNGSAAQAAALVMGRCWESYVGVAGRGLD